MRKNTVGTATEVSVRRKVKDGWHVYTCDQLPGLYVAHHDDRVAYNDVPRSIAALLRLNYDIECTVSHKVSYHEFVRLSDMDGARGAMEERTQDLIDSQVDQYFQFTLQQVNQQHR